MRLSELLEDITIIESNISLEIEIECIANDHRRIKNRSVFVALRGTKRNGNDYVNDAIKNGATAIVSDDFAKCKMAIPYVLVANAREALAKMWSNFYKNPAKEIKTVAITGTNGKTSCAYFLYNILNSFPFLYPSQKERLYAVHSLLLLVLSQKFYA